MNFELYFNFLMIFLFRKYEIFLAFFPIFAFMKFNRINFIYQIHFFVKVVVMILVEMGNYISIMKLIILE